MKIDRYTKAVLTVIALCLVWMSLGGRSLLPVVDAQGTENVVIVGWRDSAGEVWTFPVTMPPRATGFVDSSERNRIERLRAAGARLPVATP